MQAVMFVAGRGTRMGELTRNVPKPMLPINGKPVLEHKLDMLPEEIGEVILVVGYLGSVIHDYFGGLWNGRDVLYVEQENPVGGTADALWQAKSILEGKFVAMNGDDLYAAADIEACLKHEWAMLVQERDPLLSGGKIITNRDGRITDIKEGTHEGAGLINAGLYILDQRIFEHELVPKAPGSSEFGLPQTILAASKEAEIRLDAVKSTFWLQITAPEDLQKAEQVLKNRGN